METNSPYITIYKRSGSEPTYEEWKRQLQTTSKACMSGSEPTYEEWKRATDAGELETTAGSEPTYEEWKRRSRKYVGPPGRRF